MLLAPSQVLVIGTLRCEGGATADHLRILQWLTVATADHLRWLTVATADRLRWLTVATADRLRWLTIVTADRLRWMVAP